MDGKERRWIILRITMIVMCLPTLFMPGLRPRLVPRAYHHRGGRHPYDDGRTQCSDPTSLESDWVAPERALQLPRHVAFRIDSTTWWNGSRWDFTSMGPEQSDQLALVPDVLDGCFHDLWRVSIFRDGPGQDCRHRLSWHTSGPMNSYDDGRAMLHQPPASFSDKTAVSAFSDRCSTMGFPPLAVAATSDRSLRSYRPAGSRISGASSSHTHVSAAFWPTGSGFVDSLLQACPDIARARVQPLRQEALQQRAHGCGSAQQSMATRGLPYRALGISRPPG